MPDYGWTDSHLPDAAFRRQVGATDALIIINANLDDAQVTLPEGRSGLVIAYSHRVGDPRDGGVGSSPNPSDISLEVEHVTPRSTLTIEALSVTFSSPTSPSSPKTNAHFAFSFLLNHALGSMHDSR